MLNWTSPIFVFLFLAATARGRQQPVKLLGAMMGLTGVTLIVGPDVLAGLGQNVLGQGAVLLGAVMYAGAAINGRRFSGLPAAVTAFGTMLWATIVLISIALVVDQPWGLRPSITALVAASSLAVFCTGFALIIYFRLIRTLGPLGTASQSYLRAGVGVLLGYLVLAERPDMMILIGVGAAIFGVVLINFPARKVG